MSDSYEQLAGHDEQSHFEIRVRVENGVGVLEWHAETTAEVLASAVSHAADDAIIGHELRRLEVYLPAGDLIARRAVHRAGFRLEGVRRQVLQVSANEYADVCLYARLASDCVYGDNAFSSVMNSVLPKKRVLAHVVLRDGHGRFLFCKTQYKEDWELPGGVVEPGESPREGAEREVLEETGLAIAELRLLGIDWLPPYLGWEDAVQFVFDAGVLSSPQCDALEPDPGEIAELHWATLDEAEVHLAPFAMTRLRALLEEPDTPRYLEAGQRP